MHARECFLLWIIVKGEIGRELQKNPPLEFEATTKASQTDVFDRFSQLAFSHFVYILWRDFKELIAKPQ